ncbi:MAG: hypothetical protein HOZ81_05735 [Streptomyces sp.]|nr:hypothetical protein [Streptomyces sp.]NUT27245.1 hypothetical protein [Streptomyces sp.]
MTCTALGIAFGPDDDFFTAGGDSQIAVRPVSLARAASLHLGVRQVVELRTPRQLSKVLNPQRS